MKCGSCTLDPLFKVIKPCFPILKMWSYRSSSTFVAVDILFQELFPYVQKWFSGLCYAFRYQITDDSRLMNMERQIDINSINYKDFFN